MRRRRSEAQLLAQALRYQPEDLDANRQGQLSYRQRSMLRMEIASILLTHVLAVLIPAAALLIGVIVPNGLLMVLGGVFLTVVVLAGLFIWTMQTPHVIGKLTRQLREGTLIGVEGALIVNEHRRSRPESIADDDLPPVWYIMHIGAYKQAISAQQYRLLLKLSRGEHFRGYYAPHIERFVSLEELAFQTRASASKRIEPLE